MLLFGRGLEKIPSAFSMTRRWFEWDATLRRGKPAITGTNHLFVSPEIPVVMLKDVPGIGLKGEIVNVKRGAARTWLVPKELAVYGTTWENIDEYADAKVVQSAKIQQKIGDKRKRLPFDWINDMNLEIPKLTQSISGNKQLVEPISKWGLLNILSDEEELDLLPSELTMPADCEQGIFYTGVYSCKIRIPFKGWTGEYSVKLEIVSQQEVEEKLREIARQEELLRNKKQFALKPKMSFNLV